MREFSFALDRSSLDPAPATVDVTADNGGEVPHTITFYADAAFTEKVPGADSGSVAAGGSKTFSFTPPEGASELFFRCEIHPDPDDRQDHGQRLIRGGGPSAASTSAAARRPDSTAPSM